MAKTRIPLDDQLVADQRRCQTLRCAVAELDLDLRTVNGLEDIGVIYVHELVALTREELERVPNFGSKVVDDVVSTVRRLGLELREPTHG